MDSKVITAKEARQLADTSEIILNRIYKLIREEAKQGITKLIYNCQDISKVQYDNIVNTLQKLGYQVKPYEYDEEDLNTLDPPLSFVVTW